MSPSRPIDVLLWDCDGALQHGRQDWRQALDRVAGEGFAQRVYEAELPALGGAASLHTVLTELLEQARRRSGRAPVSLAFLFGLWEQFDLDPQALEVLAAVRELGVPSLLATNQHDHRAQWMRSVCRYDELVDGSYYSSELGVAKPHPAFFGAARSCLRGRGPGDGPRGAHPWAGRPAAGAHASLSTCCTRLSSAVMSSAERVRVTGWSVSALRASRASAMSSRSPRTRGFHVAPRTR